MQAQRSLGLVVSAFLVALGAACVVRSSGSTVHFTAGGEKAERSETLPLELVAGEELRVALRYGDVTVRVSDTEAAHVDARWHATGEDKAMAESVLARYKLALQRDGGSLSVAVEGEPLEIKSTFSIRSYGATVDLSLVVPSRVKLTATSGSGKLSASGALGPCRLDSRYGDVSITGARGNTTLETASGSARIADVEAEVVEATSRYGDIDASDVRAKQVRLSTSSGDVRARKVVGELSVKSSYGNLDIDEGDGDLEAVTASGKIALRSGSKARRKLSTRYGDVVVHGAQGGLAAETSSGKIEIEAFDGELRAVSSYGDVRIQARLSALHAETKSGDVQVQVAAGSKVAEPWRIRSGYGDVELSLPRADFDCRLSAQANSGDVRCDGTEPSAGNSRRTLERTLGAGGASVEADSKSGDVRIALD